MPKRTPFHDCIAPYNETEIWKRWSGYLVPPNLQYSIDTEYYAIRNSVSLLDTSPLFKYRFCGPDAVDILSSSMVRPIHQLAIGRAQYNIWCDDNGYVVQDGVLLRLAKNEFLLTAGEAALRWFRQVARRCKLDAESVSDVTDQYGILALQGPHAFNVMSQFDKDSALASLSYFGVAHIEIASRQVIVSRTGYTGDLGYEIWIPSIDAATVWRAIIEAGSGYNLTPIGTTALKMSRVEAGLLLMDVDFSSSRFMFGPSEKETPNELGFHWMLKNLDSDDREFIGRHAIEKEILSGSSRWTTIGLTVDPQSYVDRFQSAGLIPEKGNVYCESTHSLYRRSGEPWDYAGYATSFLYSSLLKQPIAIGKLPSDLATPGTQVDLEIVVARRPELVTATVSRMPFFNPSRKTQVFSKQEVKDASDV